MTAFTLFLCLFCQVLVVAGNLLLKHAMAGIDGQERSRVQTGLWLFAGIALFSLWFFLWLDLLGKYELSQLYAFEGLAPVFLMAAAWLLPWREGAAARLDRRQPDRRGADARGSGLTPRREGA
jgi:hypothetical protein